MPLLKKEDKCSCEESLCYHCCKCETDCVCECSKKQG